LTAPLEFLTAPPALLIKTRQAKWLAQVAQEVLLTNSHMARKPVMSQFALPIKL